MEKIKPMLPGLIGLGVLVIALIVVALLVPGNTDTAPTDPTATDGTVAEDPIILPEQLYADAGVGISGSDKLVLEYTFSQDRTVSGQTFTEDRTGSASYIGYNAGPMQALVRETLTYGGYTTQYYESFLSGKAYCHVNNNSYTCNLSRQEFLQLQIPALALDQTLYGSILCNTSEDSTVITFERPTALESWVTDNPDAQLVSASGTATLDALGKLTTITYHATYTIGTASYRTDLTINLSTPATLNLNAQQPSYPSNCAVLSDLRIPRYLLRVVGDLYSAASVSASYQDNLYSAVCTEIRAQSGNFDFCGSDESFMAAIDSQVNLTGFAGTTTINSQSGLFKNGLYSYSFNGGEIITDPNKTAEKLRMECEDAILSALLTFQSIASAELTDTGDFICITFVGTDTYANELCNSICSLLGLANLDTYASSFKTNAIGGYLTLNKHTVLPTAMGINFSRDHVISGVSYPLTYQLDQSIDLLGVNAYQNITGTAPETPESASAAPMFFKIQDSQGHILWLFGTVSVGDSRTAVLPSSIKDAFDAADALVVEYDPTAFAKALAEDSKLQQQLAAMYYYSDNSTTKSHMSQELYAIAYPLLLATGTNNINAPYMRVVIWQNLIEALYLQQSCALTTSQSMDQRLLEWAAAQEKPIYEIESYINVLKILSNYSDGLQAGLLTHLIREGMLTYAQDTLYLYERWCAGDREALEAIMTTDTSGMTEAELAFYNEYYKAAHTNRLKTMFNAAKSYLAGKETVFYAVNTEYLLGSDGLLAQLENAGYTVEQVPAQ